MLPKIKRVNFYQLEQKELIVIPVFNEEENLSSLLQQLKGRENNVLLVNDGSTDFSTEIIHASGFKYIDFESNKGISEVYKASLRFGIQKGFKRFITLDSDGQHDPRYIDYFSSQLNVCKLVIGNRFTRIDYIPEAKVASNLFASMLTKLLFQIELPDVACGFRACDLKTLAGRSYQSSMFGMVYEHLFYHLAENLPLAYVPIPATYPPLPIYATKKTELVSLIEAARCFSCLPELLNLQTKVEQESDFKIELFGYVFEAVYVAPHGYVFSTNISKATRYYKNLKGKMVFNY